MLVALQVVFAIMSVSPHELRLSDETIAKAIVDFYKSSNLLPPGISVSALSDWAGKMAHGARKVTGKFRRLYAATPENSKDPALRDLKFRCQEAGIPTAPGCDNSDKSADSRPASHEDLEEVSCSAPSWTEALKNKLLAKNKEKEAAQKQAATARPVATPSRNSHEVPKFVLDKLAEKTPEVAPFVATAAEEEPVVREPGKDKKKKAPKSKSKKRRLRSLDLRSKQLCNWRNQLPMGKARLRLRQLREWLRIQGSYLVPFVTHQKSSVLPRRHS